jgi:hypothetical protein
MQMATCSMIDGGACSLRHARTCSPEMGATSRRRPGGAARFNFNITHTAAAGDSVIEHILGLQPWAVVRLTVVAFFFLLVRPLPPLSHTHIQAKFLLLCN